MNVTLDAGAGPAQIFKAAIRQTPWIGNTEIEPSWLRLAADTPRKVVRSFEMLIQLGWEVVKTSF